MISFTVIHENDRLISKCFVVVDIYLIFPSPFSIREETHGIGPYLIASLFPSCSLAIKTAELDNAFRGLCIEFLSL